MREDLLQLITDEQDSYNHYSRLCERYQVEQDPIVIAVAKAKMDLLKKLLDLL
jgi:hypothetical protein